MKIRKSITLFVLLGMSLACSENPPVMSNAHWQVILFRNRLSGATYQKLSVFVEGRDEDGKKDLAAFYVIHDGDELYWSLPPEKWDTATIGDGEWFGSNGLTMPYGQPLPVGAYRLVLEDFSGKTVESQIYVKKQNIDTKEAVFPEIKISAERIQILGDFIDPEVWVYDSNEQYLSRQVLPQKTIEIRTILNMYSQLESGFTYYLYAKQRGAYYSVMTGPYYYSP